MSLAENPFSHPDMIDSGYKTPEPELAPKKSDIETIRDWMKITEEENGKDKVIERPILITKLAKLTGCSYFFTELIESIIRKLKVVPSIQLEKKKTAKHAKGANLTKIVLAYEPNQVLSIAAIAYFLKEEMQKRKNLGRIMQTLPTLAPLVIEAANLGDTTLVTNGYESCIDRVTLRIHRDAYAKNPLHYRKILPPR